MKKFLTKIKISRIELSLFLLIPFLYLIKSGFKVSNDSWFLLNHGRYVLENGLPYIEPFTIHKNFNFIMQQWLYSVFFYLIYKKFSFWGLIIFSFILYVTAYYAFYKLCLLVSKENRIVATIFSVIFGTFFISCDAYFATRPQMISYLIIILWIYICEKYYRDKKVKLLFLLPILSVLEINFHSSCWFLLIIFSLPFYFEYAIEAVKKRKISDEFKFFVLFLCLAFIAGLVNPYGAENLVYIANALHANTNIIYEMKKIELFSYFGIVIYSLLFVYILALTLTKTKSKNIELRHIFFVVGTHAFSLNTIKSGIYFVMISCYCISSLLPEFLKNKVDNKKLDNNRKAVCFILCLSLICTITFCSIRKTNTSISSFRYNYYTIKKDFSKNTNIKNARVYTNYSNGGILEYMGYKCYIDARAEVFYKQMNKREDIFNEFYVLSIGSGKLEREEFLKKYNFTNLFITNGDTFYGNKKIKGYTLVAERDNYRLYTRNDLFKRKK